MSAQPFTLEHFRCWAGGLLLKDGRPWELEPFQEAFVEDVFTGVPECWFVVPEGNGKTTLLAGMVLYHAEHVEDAWVPVAASARQQAKIIYRQAKGFVRRTERLKELFRCYDGYLRIVHLENGAQIEIFAADAATGDGVIPTWCVLDELHRHDNLELYLTWSGKLDKENAQLLTISTAGEPGGEFEETRERLRQDADLLERNGCHVRAVSETSVLHEWAVPEDGDPEDLALVKAANPFSGITVESLRTKRKRFAGKDAHWRRFTCNLPTRSGHAAVPEAEWYAAETEMIPDGEMVMVGLDVGWNWDTTAIVPLWWKSEDHRVLGPATVLEPPRDGTSLDPHLVEAAFVELYDRWPFETVVMDMSRAEQLAYWIEEEFQATAVARPQSNQFAVEDYDRFMEALRQGWLRHTGDRMLSRHVLNATVQVLPRGDARFRRPSESRGGNQDLRVIDALAAAAMVHTFAATNAMAGSYVA